jgi:hypothetical protein
MLELSRRAVLFVSGKTVQGDFSALEISVSQDIRARFSPCPNRLSSSSNSHHPPEAERGLTRSKKLVERNQGQGLEKQRYLTVSELDSFETL